VAGPGERPSFSIIVPTYGRPERLRECLASLAAQDYPHGRIEVVVVNDGWEPRARLEESVTPFAGSAGARLLHQEKAGPAAARNLGARAARHPLLAFTDDDCRPDRGWLQALAPALAGSGNRVAGGATVNGLEEDRVAAASQLLVTYLYGYYLREKRPFFASNNLGCSRALFLRLGGFDTRFPLAGGEDREFCDRCLGAGVEMVYVPQARVEHRHALTVGGFLRQHYNYGRGAYAYHRIREERGGGRVGIEPPRFYRDLLLSPFTLGARGQRLSSGLLLFFSQFANAAGFYREKLFPPRHPRKPG